MRRWSLLRRSKNRRLRPAPRVEPAPLAVAGDLVGDPASGPQRRSGWRAVLVTLAMSLCGVGVGFGLWAAERFVRHSPHFAVREVRVPSLTHRDADALRRLADVPLGVNLFSVHLDEVTRRLRTDPWIVEAEAHRELPGTIVISATEHEAACVVALGGIYLADERGMVFKRADPEEAASWPVVTGVPRDAYVADREAAQSLIREGIATLREWSIDPARPAIGEIHVDPAAGVTLYTRSGSLAVHLGSGDDESLRAGLRRLDAVRSTLAASEQRAAVIWVDRGSRSDRVTVRLAEPEPTAQPLEQ